MSEHQPPSGPPALRVMSRDEKQARENEMMGYRPEGEAAPPKKKGGWPPGKPRGPRKKDADPDAPPAPPRVPIRQLVAVLTALEGAGATHVAVGKLDGLARSLAELVAEDDA